jgi:hypothetical protein
LDPSKVVGDRALIEELTTDRDHLDELLRRIEDYVLIKGQRIIGIFTDRQEAIEKAYDLFAEEPALVTQIAARERIHMLAGVILMMAVHVLNSMPPLIQVGIRTNRPGPARGQGGKLLLMTALIDTGLTMTTVAPPIIAALCPR